MSKSEDHTSEHDDAGWQCKHFRLLNGYCIEKALFYRYLAIASCLGIAMLALIGLFVFRGLDVEVLSSADLAVDTRSLEEASATIAPSESSLEAVLRLHTARVGMADFESLKIRGSYETFGVTFDLNLYVKSPMLYRQALQHKALLIDAGFDGESYWQVNPLVATEKDASNSARLNRSLLVLQCAHGVLCWQTAGGVRQGIEVLRQELRNGANCVVLRNAELIESPVEHWIDLASGLELYRESTVRMDEGEVQVRIEYTYSESALSRAPVISDQYTIFANEELLATVTIASVLVNAGIVPWMFERP